MTEEPLEPVSPLALPQHKPARARHQPPPKKEANMKSYDKLSQMATEHFTRPPIDTEALLARKQGDIFPVPDVASLRPKTVEEVLNSQNAKIKDVLALPDEPEQRPTLLRRRTQDEMLRALHLLASGQQRPRDDDSPAVLEDAIYEVATLRQIVADLMQGASNMYQGGMASIRKMTER